MRTPKQFWIRHTSTVLRCTFTYQSYFIGNTNGISYSQTHLLMFPHFAFTSHRLCRFPAIPSLLLLHTCTYLMNSHEVDSCWGAATVLHDEVPTTCFLSAATTAELMWSALSAFRVDELRKSFFFNFGVNGGSGNNPILPNSLALLPCHRQSHTNRGHCTTNGNQNTPTTAF